MKKKNFILNLVLPISFCGLTTFAQDCAKKQISKKFEHVEYSISYPTIVNMNDTLSLDVIINFKDNWHGYTDNDYNNENGNIPTTVMFVPNEYIDTIGKSTIINKDGDANTLKNTVIYHQVFKTTEVLKTDTIPLFINISWQICNEDMCMPPIFNEETIKIKSRL